MHNSSQHIVNYNDSARVALKALDVLEDNVSRTLFVVNDMNKLVGSITDGDIRRGLLNGLEISNPVKGFMNVNFKFLIASQDNMALIRSYKEAEINLVPLIDEDQNLLE